VTLPLIAPKACPATTSTPFWSCEHIPRFDEFSVKPAAILKCRFFAVQT
jgi:hypothetical protein